MESSVPNQSAHDEIVMNANHNGGDKCFPFRVFSNKEDDQDLDADEGEEVLRPATSSYPKRKRHSTSTDLSDNKVRLVACGESSPVRKRTIPLSKSVSPSSPHPHQVDLSAAGSCQTSSPSMVLQPDSGDISFTPGFDLGTTNSCAYVVKDVVRFVYSEPVYPTEVKVSAGSWSLPRRGDVSCGRLGLIKRIIGRPREDGRLESDAKGVPHAVLGVRGVMLQVKDEQFAPEEVQGFYLRKMKLAVESLYGPVSGCVLCVPAYFDSLQRESTRDAAFVGGFDRDKVVLVDEPVAAVVDYVLSGSGTGDAIDDETVVVVDIGGGTLDVAGVYPKRTGDRHRFLVKATAGNNCAGGIDVDQYLKQFVLDRARERLAFDHDGDRLLLDCEAAKKELSTTSETATIMVHALRQDREVDVLVNREEFESVCQPISDAISLAFDEFDRLHTIAPEDVKHVLLVGGSSALPCVGRLCSERFPNANIHRSKAEAEAVARGAALIASDPNIEFVQTLPRNIGISAHRTHPTDVARMDPVMRRNTQLPHTETRQFYTKTENETDIEIEILEGHWDGEDASNTIRLGSFMINLPPDLPQGTPIDVTFSVPSPDRIHVSARHQSAQADLVVTQTSRLPPETLEQYRQRTRNRLQRKAAIAGKTQAPEQEDSATDMVSVGSKKRRKVRQTSTKRRKA